MLPSLRSQVFAGKSKSVGTCRDLAISAHIAFSPRHLASSDTSGQHPLEELATLGVIVRHIFSYVFFSYYGGDRLHSGGLPSCGTIWEVFFFLPFLDIFGSCDPYTLAASRGQYDG